MQLVTSLVPLFIVFVVYAAYLKLSGRILKFQGVTWAGVFLFSLIIGALSLAVRLVTILVGVNPPLPIALALGIGCQLGLAAWFFRRRLTDRDGGPVGWIGGVKLSGLAMVFYGLTMAALFMVFVALIPRESFQ